MWILLHLQPFQMRYFVFHFWSKIIFFMRATTVNWILFLNHRNRKDVGGKHNVPVHCVDLSAPDPVGVVIWNPFIWDILWSFLVQNHIFCVCATTAKWILFLNHSNRKVVGGKHHILVHYVDVCAPDPSGVVLWNPYMRYFVVHFCSETMLFFVYLPQKWNAFYSLTTATGKW